MYATVMLGGGGGGREGLRCGCVAFLHSIPSTHCGGDMGHCCCSIVNALFKKGVLGLPDFTGPCRSPFATACSAICDASSRKHAIRNQGCTAAH